MECPTIGGGLCKWHSTWFYEKREGVIPWGNKPLSADSFAVPARRADDERSPGGTLLSGFFEWFGEFGRFCARVATTAFRPPYEWAELLRQCDAMAHSRCPWWHLQERPPVSCCLWRPPTV